MRCVVRQTNLGLEDLEPRRFLSNPCPPITGNADIVVSDVELRRSITVHEGGSRLDVYRDTEGKPTVEFRRCGS